MSKFIPNKHGMKLVGRSPEVLAAVEAAAKAGAEAAQSAAPVESGDYKDSIDSTAAIIGDEAVGRIFATDWKSGWIEFGTSEKAAQAPLRRGAESVGLKVLGGDDE